jgi:hypothetical protein
MEIAAAFTLAVVATEPAFIVKPLMGISPDFVKPVPEIVIA